MIESGQNNSTADVTVHLDARNDTPVVFTPADFDRFVMTQAEVVDAMHAVQSRETRTQELHKHVGAFLAELTHWCKMHSVQRCVISPRMDDILVVVIAPDEDNGGSLHDMMSEFDLECYRSNKLRLSWLLLRASEAPGLNSFIDPSNARTLSHAQAS